MIFLLMLIRDLDNPFGYYDRYSDEDVPPKPLMETVGRLAQLASVENDAPVDTAEQGATLNSHMR